MTTTDPTKSRPGGDSLALRASHLLTIGRWLGPWTDPQATPRVDALVVEGASRHLRLRTGDAESPRPVILLLHGLHYLGPDDPRFRRIAAVLAQTGAEVIAPYLSDFLGLALSPRALDEASAALVTASERAGGPVGVMSISFGSIAALHLGATAPERVKRLVLFGGYRHYSNAVRFALGGALEGFPAEARDPMSGPAVLVNFVDELLPAGQRAAFREAALAFAKETWSRGGPAAEDKHDGRHLRVGRRIAESLDGEAQAAFRIACRLDADPLALAEVAMMRAGERLAFLDPGPHLACLRAPVTCVHGREDDVIPWTESEAIARDVPGGRAIVTGLYGHAGRAGESAAGPGAMRHELTAMREAIGALADLCL